MERSKDNAEVSVVQTPPFEGQEILALEHNGRLLWSSARVAEALGYAEPASLGQQVREEWADDFIDGTDFIVLRGDELAAVKALAPGLIGPRSAAAMFLTESGIHMATILSRQPKARAFRRWLVDDVLPSLRKTGAFALPVPAPVKTRPQLGQRTPLPQALTKSPYGLVNELLRAEEALGEDLPGIRHALYVLRPGSVHLAPVEELLAIGRALELAKGTSLPRHTPAQPMQPTNAPALDDAMADLWRRTDGHPERSLKVSGRRVASWWGCSFRQARRVLADLEARGWIRVQWANAGDRRGSLLIVVTSASGWLGRGGAR